MIEEYRKKRYFGLDDSVHGKPAGYFYREPNPQPVENRTRVFFQRLPIMRGRSFRKNVPGLKIWVRARELGRRGFRITVRQVLV